MAKIILLSLVLVTVALPIVASGYRSPARGLRHVVLGIATFIALYVLAVVYVVPRLL